MQHHVLRNSSIVATVWEGKRETASVFDKSECYCVDTSAEGGGYRVRKLDLCETERLSRAQAT